jgi:hypothetical protein
MSSKTLMLVALALCITGFARAELIDPFNLPDGTGAGQCVRVTPLILSNQSQAPVATAIGGYRDSNLTFLSGHAPAEMDINLYDFPGLVFSQDRDTQAKGRVVWDGDNVQGNLGLNLGGGNGIGLTGDLVADVEFNDQPMNLQFTMYSGPNTADYVSTASIAVPGGIFHQPGDVTQFGVPLGSFLPTMGAANGADMSHVRSIVMEISGSSGGDITLTQVATVAVPEPSSILLAMSCLLGMTGYVQWRRRRANG